MKNLWLLLIAVVLCLTSVADADSGDHLWNLRENPQDFFHNNDSWVRPWRTTVDDGWGMFQGGHQFDFSWDTSSTTGDPLDGSLTIDRGANHQFHAWTYLYVPAATMRVCAATGVSANTDDAPKYLGLCGR